MTPESSIGDLADMIQSRLTKEASFMSCSMIQSIAVTLTDATRHAYEVLNSRQPLFKLPNEIIAKIARELLSCPVHDISDTDKRPMWRSTVRGPMTLLPVTHTCRRFRQVVIADITLWRHLTTRNCHFVELSLSRCGPTHPLTLWLSPGASKLMPLTDFHLQLAPRLRELHFHKWIPKNFSWLNRFILLPFPHLESFSWTGEITGSWRLSDWSEAMVRQPRLTLTMPNLRYMHAQQMYMLLPTTDIPHLTHLCISSFMDSEFPVFFGNVLRHCPALTSLVLRKLRMPGWVKTKAPAKMQPLHCPNLSRVVLADVDFPAIRYFARLFASRPIRCMQIILTDKIDALHANQGKLFAALYLKYWRSTHLTDTPRLSVAAYTSEDCPKHTSEDCPTHTGFSVTLANSTHVLHISISPHVIEWDLRRSGYCTWSEWRLSLLTPLRTLPNLREVWLTDMHIIEAWQSVDALPFSTVEDVIGDNLTYGHAQAQAQAAARQTPVPTLETVVVVYNCSTRGCHDSPSIRPTLVALPEIPYRGRDSEFESGSAGDGLPTTAPQPLLLHLILVVGYNAADAVSLRDAWHSAHLPGGNGQVEMSAELLREAASDAYAYVRHAALRVQLMPHLALAPGELARLRECFASVEVEEIDRIPTVPVPECARDDMLAPGAFVSGSILCSE